jgi:hypothetical protein
MSSYDIVIDSSTRKERATTDANNFTVYLSTPLYGIQSVNFVSASIPYLNSASQVNGNVHAYYIVLEVPNYGILTDRIYTVDNPLVYGGKIVTKGISNYNNFIIKLTSLQGVVAGMTISGTGISGGTTIATVNGLTSTIVLSQTKTGSVSSTATIEETNSISSKSEDYFITVSDIDELSVGMTASGTGIDASATISAFADATTVILSLPNTGTVSGTITFNGNIEKTGSSGDSSLTNRLYVTDSSSLELYGTISLSGTGIPGSTTISSISGNIITLNNAVTSSINSLLSFERTVTPTMSDISISGSDLIAIDEDKTIEVGMDVSGTGIGSSAVVSLKEGNVIKLSVNNTSTVSGLITFSLPQINNRFDFAYTGSLAVPSLAGASPTNYVMSSMNDSISVQKTVPVMEAIKVSIYYYDTSDSSFKLYPFTNSGSATEEFVLKLSVQATKDKRFATRQQDEDDKRLEPKIAPPVTPGSENTFARKLINYYKSTTRNKLNPEEPTEPVGALLPRREFMGVPTKYAQILIPIAVVLLVLAILLAK